MRSALRAAAAACGVVFVLAACGSTTPVAQRSPSPSAAASASAGATPSGAVSPSASPASGQCQTFYPLPGLCSGVAGRAPTHDEYGAMSTAAAPVIEKALGYSDWSTCSNGQNCFRVAPEPSGLVGTNAGVLNGGYGQYPGGGLGAACWMFLYSDASGWHLLNFACAQNPGFTPGSADTGTHVYVSGCANFRAAPSLAANVLGCLGNRTVVNVDGGPTYADGHIWWQLSGRGWMAHDYLCEICRV